MVNIEQSWIDNASKRTNDMLAYQNWFDECRSLDECVKNGFIDFTTRIFTKDFYKIVGDPRNKSCLEIGFGGGRILNAANHFFQTAYGLDILDERSIQTTTKFMKDNGAKNFKLLHRDKKDTIPDKSINFVYSFIVFQHFNSWDEAEKYLKFINRTLVSGGAGIIYFGLNTFGSDVHITNESKFQARECSLFATEDFVKDKMKDMFDILETGRTTRKEWLEVKSGQFYVKFQKR